MMITSLALRPVQNSPVTRARKAKNPSAFEEMTLSSQSSYNDDVIDADFSEILDSFQQAKADGQEIDPQYGQVTHPQYLFKKCYIDYYA